MKKELYILDPGKLFVDKGTISFIDINKNKTTYPLYNLREIFCLNSVGLTSGAINRLLKRGIITHFLSKEGIYLGNLSKNSVLDSRLIEKQVLYTKNEKRIEIGKEIISSLKIAMKYLLIRYRKKGYELQELIEKINEINPNKSKNIEELRGIEANLWRETYEGLRRIIKNFEFEKREYNPPKKEINSMISFGNMILYGELLSITKAVGLIPEIGFIHENNGKRYNLVLDMSEIFKPLIVLNTIIYLINKKIIIKEDFIEKSGIFYLNNEGKYTFIKEIKKRLENTFFLKQLNRNISIRGLIKYELTKLKTAILQDKRYNSFKQWYLCL